MSKGYGRIVKYREPLHPPDHITGQGVDRAKAAGYKQEYDSDKTPFPHGSLVQGTKITVRAKPQNFPTESTSSNGALGSFKKGGRVRKTGKYKLHKGEQVVPAHRVKNLASKLRF